MVKRHWRHLLFWMCWIFGFTFIKSFGQPFPIYLDWLAYYLVTLPIFAAHTYLVAYLLIPLLANKRLIPLFILLFLGFFYGFSMLELLVSNEWIYHWTDIDQEVISAYLEPSNVIRSGVGNLYIVLVFLAARTIRHWYLADRQQKELAREELQSQMKEAVSRVQPAMLLFAVDRLDLMVNRSSPDVTAAIAKTSELLSDVMIYHEQRSKLFSMEVGLVNKLISLVSLFRGEAPDIEIMVSGDPDQIQMPPMILFSVMDLIFRKFQSEPRLPEIHVEISGFAQMINLQMLHSQQKRNSETMEKCLDALKQLRSCFLHEVEITHETHEYGCSLMIRNNVQHRTVKGVHPLHRAVGTS